MYYFKPSVGVFICWICQETCANINIMNRSLNSCCMPKGKKRTKQQYMYPPFPHPEECLLVLTRKCVCMCIYVYTHTRCWLWYLNPLLHKSSTDKLFKYMFFYTSEQAKCHPSFYFLTSDCILSQSHDIFLFMTRDAFIVLQKQPV